MRIIIQTVVYGSETWSFSAQERRKIEVLEITLIGQKCACEMSHRDEIVAARTAWMVRVCHQMKCPCVRRV